MIIDCHGHYTTAPAELQKYRDSQVAGLKDPAHRPAPANLRISDDQIRESLEGAQLKFQRERGTDLTIFSPRASAMAHHVGNETTSLNWSRACNDLIHRVCSLYPCQFRRRVPATAVARGRARKQCSGARTVREGTRASSAATSIPTLRAVIGTLRRSRTATGIRSTRRWSSSTCRRWCTSAPPAIRISMRPVRTTSTPTRPPSCSS